MGASVVESVGIADRPVFRNAGFKKLGGHDEPVPGVYVPDSGLTPVKELARLLKLWDGEGREREARRLA